MFNLSLIYFVPLRKETDFLTTSEPFFRAIVKASLEISTAFTSLDPEILAYVRPVSSDELVLWNWPSTPTSRASSALYTTPTRLAVSAVCEPDTPGATKIPKAAFASQPAWPVSSASSP